MGAGASKDIQVETRSRTELRDITPELHSFLRDSGADSGTLTVFVPHTTAGVTINENADPDVAVGEVEALRDEAGDLADARPGRVEGLEEGPIAQALRRRGVRDGQEPVDLARRQDVREAAPELRAVEDGRRAVRDALLADAWPPLRRAPLSRELDRLLLAMIRPIHRVMFVPGGVYHADPGMYGQALPGLEPARILAEEEEGSDRYGFAMTSLVRERNRILEALDDARANLQRLLEASR